MKNLMRAIAILIATFCGGAISMAQDAGLYLVNVRTDSTQVWNCKLYDCVLLFQDGRKLLTVKKKDDLPKEKTFPVEDRVKSCPPDCTNTSPEDLRDMILDEKK